MVRIVMSASVGQMLVVGFVMVSLLGTFGEVSAKTYEECTADYNSCVAICPYFPDVEGRESCFHNCDTYHGMCYKLLTDTLSPSVDVPPQSTDISSPSTEVPTLTTE